jgi:hypothetical protein
VEFEAASGRPGGARRCRQVELAATGCRPGGARGGGRSGGGEVEGKAAASGWNESALGFQARICFILSSTCCGLNSKNRRHFSANV